MIKYLIALLLITSTCAAGIGIGITPYPGPGGKLIESGGVPDGVAYWWTANALSSAQDYYGSLSAPTVYGTPPAYVTGRVSNAMSELAGSRYVIIPSGAVNGTSGKLGFWMKWTTTVTGNARLIDITAGTNYIYVAMNTAGTRVATTYYDGTTTRIASSTTDAVVAGTWYFVEVKWNVVGGSLTLTSYINGVQHATVTAVENIAAISTAPVKFGFVVGSPAAEVLLDNLIIATDSTIDINVLSVTDGV